MISRHATFALLFAAITAVACGSKDQKDAVKPEEPGEVAEPAKVREPNKEAFLEDFDHLCKILVEGKYEESLELVMLPKGMSRKRAMDMMPKLVGLLAISQDGIKVLAEKGEFGKAADLFPTSSPDLASRARADLDKSWAISLPPAQVMGEWDGERFKFFKFDKVGLIAQDPSVMEEAKRILSGKPLIDAGQREGEGE